MIGPGLDAHGWGRAHLRRGALVGLVIAPDGASALAAGPPGPVAGAPAEPDTGPVLWAPPAGPNGTVATIRAIEGACRPRWVVWSATTTGLLIRAGVRVATCWDISAVHRMLFGGWRSDPARVWAQLHHLPCEAIPVAGPPSLFGGDEGDPEDPVRGDGYLRADWVGGGWSDSPARAARWAESAVQVARLQEQWLGRLVDRPAAMSTARSESAAELLGAEMSVDGLPMDRAVAETIIAGFIGSRPRSRLEAEEQRARRDLDVVRHAPAGMEVDLRSPGAVRSLLARAGVDVPDTRAWRLRAYRHTHPLVDALLTWRAAERMATTFGYEWLDEHLGPDGRLRGRWSGSDGAAGRMTASSGLHNMPAVLRPAVRAEAGHVFVRSDLGQIEPRVLAAVSRDKALARASAADDLYAPVAQQLGVDRDTAKVAVLGAMYGQTTGHGAEALRGLESAYPVAMAYLRDAARRGEAGEDLRTYGGRAILMAPPTGTDRPGTPAEAAARGRYGRNAMVQGAAAELFKLWAVTVRARGAGFDARIVLCLHDEILVQVPDHHARAAVTLLDDCLAEATARWAPDTSVRFVADVSVIRRWSDAKDPSGTPPTGAG